MTVVRVVKKSALSLSNFGKSNFTHLTTNVMFSGQRFAILAMFFKHVLRLLLCIVVHFLCIYLYIYYNFNTRIISDKDTRKLR